MWEQPWKRPDDEFLLAVAFDTWPLQPDETLVNVNSRGSLAVRAEDADGQDVSAELVETPVIIGTAFDTVGFFVKGGTAGSTYWITVDAPTSDDELLTSRFPLEVRETYRT